MAQTKVVTRPKDEPRTTKDNRQTGKVSHRRMDRVLAAAVVVVVALAGVVIWQATHAKRSSGSAAAHGAASNSGNTSGVAPYHVPESAFASQPPLTGAAVTKYGQPTLQKVYRQMVNFAFDAGWDPVLMAKTKTALSTRDFATVRLSLTPTCAKAFDANVTKALAGDKTAIRQLEGSMFFAVGGIDAKGAADRTSTISNRAFTRAKFTVDKSHGQRLSMSFTAKATVHTQDAAGKRYSVLTARAVHYLLVPNSGSDANVRPFLIDAWASRMESKPPKAE